MKRGKKVLSTILALVMVLALLPAAAWAYFDIKDGEVRGYYGDGKDVTIPDGVTRIRGDTFLDYSSMTSVTIPDSVTSVERGMFRHCENLTRIEVGEGNSVYSSQEGVLFNKEKTELLACPPGKAGHYTIPSSVASIGKYAFNGCKNLTGVTIPDSVTTIGEYAFSGCDATSVTIPDSVTIIRECAFSGSGLTSVTIPNSVLYIERDAFRDCERLTSVTISASLRFMGENAFNGCDNLYSVVFEEGAATIGTFAFYACKNLTYVQLPNTVTRIGNMPFSSCPWFDSGEGDWLILSGHLLRYRGTDSVVTVPEGVVTIDAAFMDNKNITKVTLPDTVTRIGWAAFTNCSNLTRLDVPASVRQIDYNEYYGSFDGCSRDLKIHCPPGSYTAVTLAKEGGPVVIDLPWTAPKSAYAATQRVLVDGETVEFQMYALKDEKGNPTNYVKLRDVASVLSGTAAQFEVGWDKDGVTITTGKPYTPNGSEMQTPFSGDRAYTLPTGQTQVNGKPADLEAIVLTDNKGGQYTYYKLRDLGTTLGFQVDWSKEKGVFIETK